MFSPDQGNSEANLARERQEQDDFLKQAQRNQFNAGKVWLTPAVGATWLVVIVSLVLWGLGGISLASFNSKLKTARENVSSLQQELAQPQLKEISGRIDKVSNALGIIAKASAKVLDTEAFWASLRKNVINGVSLASMDYSDDGKLVLNMESKDFPTVAKQLEVLRRSSEYKNSELTSIAKQEGGVAFSVSASYQASAKGDAQSQNGVSSQAPPGANSGEMQAVSSQQGGAL